MEEFEQRYIERLHLLRGEYDRLRPVLDLIARIADEEVKLATKFTYRPALWESRIKSLDGMRLHFVERYGTLSRQLADLESRGERVAATGARRALSRFLDDPIPYIEDVIGLRYVTTYNYAEYRRRIAPRFRSFDTEDEARFEPVDYSPKAPQSAGLKYEMADHLVGRLTDHQVERAIAQARREGLTVSTDDLRRFPFEIQLRTTVVHAWTVISHERIYKVSGRTKVAADMSDLLDEVMKLQAAFDRLTTEDDLWLDGLMEQLARTKTRGGEFDFRKPSDKDRLFAEPCSDDQALSAYAMYRFFDVYAYGPTNEISPLWIDQCVKGLAAVGLGTIGDLDRHVNGAIDEVVEYRDALAEAHPRIFKDATDWLSKCLIFSLEHFQMHYPYGEETRRELLRLGKPARGLDENARAPAR